jgi:hypothetical protein
MRRIYRTFFLLSLTLVAALGCGGDIFDGLRNHISSLESIIITPSNLKIARGFTAELKATGIYENKIKRDLTQDVRWSSSNAATGEFSNDNNSSGLFKAKSSGTTVVTASIDGVIGSSVFTVTSANLKSIQITPVNRSIPSGLSENFRATGIFSDGSNRDITADVTWSVENHDPEVAAAVISNQTGREGIAFAQRPGEATIRATMPGVGFFDTEKTTHTLFTVK